MSVISMKKLLEVGSFFDIKQKDGIQNGSIHFHIKKWIYIIDLQKSSKKIDDAYKAMNEIAAKGGKVLFVGTKKQAQETVKEEAIRSESFYVNSRWLENFNKLQNNSKKN